MGKMKDLDTIGKDLEQLTTLAQLFVPMLEELKDIQESYLDLLRSIDGQSDTKPPEDQNLTL